VDRDDGLCARGYFRPDLRGIDIKGYRVDIHKDRPGPEPGDAAGGPESGRIAGIGVELFRIKIENQCSRTSQSRNLSIGTFSAVYLLVKQSLFWVILRKNKHGSIT
jgi:hypothetical protein